MTGFVLKRLAEHGQAIFARYAQGANFDELGARYGCSGQTVRRFLIANEVPLREPPPRLKLEPFEAEIREACANGAGTTELAARYGVEPGTVRRFLVAKRLR